MKQEDKELFLKDLCARLPYGVKIHIKGEYNKSHQINSINVEDEYVSFFENWHLYDENLNNCKLYLRPMSSMTEEEEDSLAELNCYHDNKGLYFSCGHSQNDICDVINFLNSHHFDYQKLIEKGLALEAKEGMYNKV